jgi:glycosyltransferase involved in cell wall biosynthesis
VAERIAAKFVVRVIAVSEETKQNLVRHEGIDERKIRVIINGVAKERYSVSVDRDATLKRLGIHGFDFYVGLGVVLTDQKGIIHLIRAAPTVLKAFPRTAFVIAGDGPIKNELMVEAKRVGVEKEFFFLGMRDDIPELLQILDVYVLPSEWEGLPLVILEAMAARRCVLATDVGGVSLAIKDGVNGLLIPSKDPQQIAEKLVFLLSRPELRQELGKNAYSTYEAKFSVERMVRDYEEEYLAALGR